MAYTKSFDLSGMQRSRMESRSSTGSLVNAGALVVATPYIIKQLNRCMFHKCSMVRQDSLNNPP
jgi:hypothetical protein